ncbi:RNA polymerase II mediator complex subunit [Komagataella phaffii CBS 7435]|uniref:Mediator of RNA polymerase II transcription subunit 12 n=2 Tax=Komagataella phaffii TaxID=460519 RepID=C4QWE6_KOMPG|nr:uncharacterized protein PAS_chr1-1_0483 [Komagataella phaffii GS115]AOA60542.1 GQ67_02782T0 [Komagataella phaffii]CAH2446239.1 RNA polymerase II mediator complex subunit [Komagataella phaffii CBS 7435]AOA65743.1 GQ68_02466T0 [Komagataella phaffii GS115]CAY67569.1 hypothetical protein PAS_chr1-1_0483 [Komagataella phaffii GS115]CCA36665.1 RNA polymerase II mediator complex subunit [Komagataella phaffii CBS 7435]
METNRASEHSIQVPPGVYPLNGHDSVNEGPKTELIYPDFKIWQHSPQDDIIMTRYLQKGFFEAPVVQNESLSARSLMAVSLHENSNEPNASEEQTAKAPNPKIKLLSDYIIQAIFQRRQLSKIHTKVIVRPPPRVTLTEHKREKWMENLANTRIPLSQLARAIPHGIKNRILLEQCCLYNVPVARAVWLVKCVAGNEVRVLRRKVQQSSTNALSTNAIFNTWLSDWTDQVTNFLERFMISIFTPNQKDWRERSNYNLTLVGNLFMEDLLRQDKFLGWIVSFLRQCLVKLSSGSKEEPDHVSQGLNLLTIHLVILRLFWFKILKSDHISKEASVVLLQLHAKLVDKSTLQSGNSPSTFIIELKENINFLIKYLFYYSPDAFIIPNYWHDLKHTLKKILDTSNNLVRTQFKLVTYRNESLIVNLPQSLNKPLNLNQDEPLQSNRDDLLKSLDTFFSSSDSIGTLTSLVFEKIDEDEETEIKTFAPDIEPNEPEASETIEIDSPIKNSPIPNNKEVSPPITTKKGNKKDTRKLWSYNFRLLLNWSISNYRNQSSSVVQVNLVVSILEQRLREIYSNTTNLRAKKLKLEIELELLDWIFQINDSYNVLKQNNETEIVYKLETLEYLCARCYQSGLLTVSSYIRKLIASGVIYLPDCFKNSTIHSLVLKSLPVLKNNNLDNILRKLSNKEEPYDSAKDILFFEEAKSSLLPFIEWIVSDFEINLDPVWNCLKSLDTKTAILVSEWFMSETFRLLFERTANKNQVKVTEKKLSLITYALVEKLNCLPQFYVKLLQAFALELKSFSIDKMTMIFISEIIQFHEQQAAVFSAKEETNAYTNMIKSLFQVVDEGKYLINWTVFKPTLVNDKNVISELSKRIELSKKSYIKDLSNLYQLNLRSSSFLLHNMNSKVENLLNFNGLVHNTHTLAGRLWDMVRKKSFTNTDIPPDQYERDLFQSLKLMKLERPNDLVKAVLAYTKKNVLATLSLEYTSITTYILKLFLNEVLDLEQLWDLFSTVNDTFTDVSCQKFLKGLMFDKYFSDIECIQLLSDFELLKLKMVRSKVKQTDFKSWCSRMRQCLLEIDSPETNNGRTNSTPVSTELDQLPTSTTNNLPTPMQLMSTPTTVSNFDSMLSTTPFNSFLSRFKDEVMETCKEMINVHTELSIKFFNGLTSSLQGEGMSIRILNQLLLQNDQVIVSCNDMSKVLQLLDPLNLGVCQLLTKTLHEKAFQYKRKKNSMNHEEKSSLMADLTLCFLKDLMKMPKYQHSDHKSLELVGELFRFLEPDLKLLLLHSCELFFLTSEMFPLVNSREDNPGDNTLDILYLIINSCTRYEDLFSLSSKYQNGIPIPDNLVFSLTVSLEKMIGKCARPKRKLDKHAEQKAIESSILLVCRIILIHKGYLVGLILKRSTGNINKDSFLQNLVKLFNSKFIKSSSKLENLLYDIIVSIKILIGEHIGSTNHEILNVSPPDYSNKLNYLLENVSFQDGLRMSNDSQELFVQNTKTKTLSKFYIRPYELLPETTTKMEESCINLHLFNASTELKNPK